MADAKTLFYSDDVIVRIRPANTDALTPEDNATVILMANKKLCRTDVDGAEVCAEQGSETLFEINGAEARSLVRIFEQAHEKKASIIAFPFAPGQTASQKRIEYLQVRFMEGYYFGISARIVEYSPTVVGNQVVNHVQAYVQQKAPTKGAPRPIVLCDSVEAALKIVAKGPVRPESAR